MSDAAHPSAAPLDLDALERTDRCRKCGGWTANADGHRDGCPDKRVARTCRTPYPGGTCGCGCGCDENRGRPEDGTCTCSECSASSHADLKRAAEIVRRSARRYPNSGHELVENALADRLEAYAALVAAARRGVADTERLDAIDAQWRTKPFGYRAITLNGWSLAVYPEGYHVAADVFSEPIADKADLRAAIDAARAALPPEAP